MYFELILYHWYFETLCLWKLGLKNVNHLSDYVPSIKKVCNQLFKIILLWFFLTGFHTFMTNQRNFPKYSLFSIFFHLFTEKLFWHNSLQKLMFLYLNLNVKVIIIVNLKLWVEAQDSTTGPKGYTLKHHFKYKFSLMYSTFYFKIWK